MRYSRSSPQVVAARVQRLVDDVRSSAALVKDLIFKSALDYVVLYSDATTMQTPPPVDADQRRYRTDDQQRSVRCNGLMRSLPFSLILAPLSRSALSRTGKCTPTYSTPCTPT